TGRTARRGRDPRPTEGEPGPRRRGRPRRAHGKRPTPARRPSLARPVVRSSLSGLRPRMPRLLTSKVDLTYHGGSTMSIFVRFRPVSATTQQYDETISRLQSSGDFPPDGLEYHVAFS